jgi:hypothetical protein
LEKTEGEMAKEWEEMDSEEKLEWLHEHMVTRAQLGAVHQSLGNFVSVVGRIERQIDALEKGQPRPAS